MFEHKSTARFFGRKGDELPGNTSEPTAGTQTENSISQTVDEGWTYGRALAPESFARLYDRYFARLYNYVSYRTSSREEAEDVVGFVFERILSKFETFNPQKGNLDSWIFSIAHHAVSNRRRDSRRHPAQTLSPDLELASDLSLNEQVLKQEDLERLRNYMGRLNDKERELLALRYGAGLPHRRIGELLNMSEGNVAVSLGRIVRKLRLYFEADDATDEAARGGKRD